MVYTQNIIEHVLARNMLLILSWYTNIEQYTHTHTHTHTQTCSATYMPHTTHTLVKSCIVYLNYCFVCNTILCSQITILTYYNACHIFMNTIW